LLPLQMQLFPQASPQVTPCSWQDSPAFTVPGQGRQGSDSVKHIQVPPGSQEQVDSEGQGSPPVA
jgi:hypothetical protein